MTATEHSTLMKRRKTEFPEKWPKAPDFCPSNGRCYVCGHDFVDECGERFPTAFITGCPKCHRSYCD